MTLEEFAKKAGVTFVECDPEWGGPVGYKEKDYPNMVVAGFKTKEAALKSWLKSSFGEQLSKVVTKLLVDSEKSKVKK